MKKILTITLFLFSVLILVSPVLAIDFGLGDAQQAAKKAGYAENTSDTTLAETVGVVIKIVLGFVGTIFFVLMFYAGYLWMTAAGEEEKVKKAQNIMKSSVIGVIITVGAYSIANFVVPAILTVVAK